MSSPDKPAERQSGIRLPGAIWVVVAALVSYVIFWFVMAEQFRDAVRDWAEEGDRLRATYSGMVLSGFPFVVRLTVGDVVLAWSGSWAWRRPLVVLEARPWSPWRVRVKAPGEFELDLPGADGPAAWKGVAREISAEVTFEGGRIRDGRIRISGLDMAGAAGRLAVASGAFRLRVLGGVDADHLTASADLRVEAKDVEAPGELPLGGHLGRIVLTARVMGGIGRGPEALAQWRDKGGTVEVPNLAVDYGPLDMRASGTVALDGAMQPVGAFTARIRGFFQTVDALKDRGLIRARDAITAKVVLGVLARNPGDGGPPVLNLAVTIQDRKVYVGPVVLAEVPEIHWP